MPPMVLLLHELPDGSSHYDLMLARSADAQPDQRVLITFRLTDRIDLARPSAAGPVELLAVRLADHRAAYLAYEGPVHAGADSTTLHAAAVSTHPDSSMGVRGRVRRLAAGTCRIEALTPAHARFRIRFAADAPLIIHANAEPASRAHPLRESTWRLRITLDSTPAQP